MPMPKKKITKVKTNNKTAKTTKKVKVAVQTPVADTVVQAVSVVPSAPVKSEAEKIWEEIQLLPIEMFALPNQVVAQHCDPLPFAIDPNRLFLFTRSTATLPSLEATLDAYSVLLKKQATEMAKRGHVIEVKEYKVELADKYVIVSRATPQLPAALLAALSKKY